MKGQKLFLAQVGQTTGQMNRSGHVEACVVQLLFNVDIQYMKWSLARIFP